jgi:hypothetical protein
MAYADITLAQMKTQLSIRLGDPSKVFWTDAELEVYVKEALRTWGALTLYWRDRGLISTVANQAYYHLPSAVGGSLLTQTLSDVSVATTLEYHLMEPPTPSFWSGSELYTLADLEEALQNRLTQFVLETGLGLQRSEQVVVQGQSEVLLDDAVMEVRRVWWRTFDGAYKPVIRTDEHRLDYSLPTRTVDFGTPAAYSVATSEPLSLTLAPAPADQGRVQLLTINAGTPVDLDIGGEEEDEVILAIPDDLGWVIKWGALADLFSKDGPARDMIRAEYCERRWREGIETAKIYPSVLAARSQDKPIPVTTLYALDMTLPNWQSGTGTPVSMAMAGYELAALYPIPSAADMSITVDVVRKAPIPTTDSAFLQIGQEHYGILLDYAQHLALIKVGGEEFQSSTQLYDRMVRAASLQNSRLLAQAEKFDALRKRTSAEEEKRIRFAPSN